MSKFSLELIYLGRLYIVVNSFNRQVCLHACALNKYILNSCSLICAKYIRPQLILWFSLIEWIIHQVWVELILREWVSNINSWVTNRTIWGNPILVTVDNGGQAFLRIMVQPEATKKIIITSGALINFLIFQRCVRHVIEPGQLEIIQ